MTEKPATLQATPLHAVQRGLGAQMVDFGGWDMPVQYSGILEEHHAVRKSVGLFDVSHMGEIEIHGPEAFALTDYVTTNAVAKLTIGQAQYSGLLYDHGGVFYANPVHQGRDQHPLPFAHPSPQHNNSHHHPPHNPPHPQLAIPSH